MTQNNHVFSVTRHSLPGPVERTVEQQFLVDYHEFMMHEKWRQVVPNLDSFSAELLDLRATWADLLIIG